MQKLFGSFIGFSEPLQRWGQVQCGLVLMFHVFFFQVNCYLQLDTLTLEL